MLRISDLNYVIKDKVLLSDINLELEPAKLHLVMGPNGAGKSTFVRLISGQLKPSQGNIYYDNISINQYTTAELAKIRVVLSQHNTSPFSLKVWEVIMMGRYPHYTGKPKQKDFNFCEAMMAFADVTSFADREFNTLSGGEKQRVHFARVLAQLGNLADKDNIKYFILDEPLNFLDIYYQHYFMKKLRSILNDQLIIIGVIHDLHLAFQYADNLIFLKKGQLVEQGMAKELKEIEILKNVFEIDIESTNSAKIIL